MDKIIFVDFQTKITALWLNTVSDTVWGALGQASTPQEARQFIGAVEEAPSDGNAYLRAGGGWSRADTSLSHNALGGRSVSDAHPTSAITGLDSALAGKAPLASPAFTGNPTAPTPTVGDNDTSIATTAFVKTALDNQASSGMLPSNDPPIMDGVAFAGVAATGSRSDHVHPTDASRAPASAATASGTSFTPAGTIAASTVQAAIAELDSETQTALAGKAPTSAGTAIGTTFTPVGNLAATNVQAAIQELDSEKAPTSAGTATGTSFTPTGTIAATNVQDAIAEVAAEAAVVGVGSVLQMLYFNDNGSNTTSPSLANVTNTLSVITPKSTNSQIIVECSWQGGVQNGSGINSVGVYQIYQGSVAGVFGFSSSVSAPSGAGGIGVQCRQHLMARFNNTTLEPKAFGLAAAINTGSGLMVYGTAQCWKITEVQN
jgi:hypothetical protein